MGERVVIHPEQRAQPQAEQDRADPPTAVPLDYGHGSRSGDWLRGIGRRFEAFFDAISDVIIPSLGGWRQVTFAFGLSMVLGALGAALNPGGPAFFMWVGGWLVGLTIPLNKKD